MSHVCGGVTFCASSPLPSYYPNSIRVATGGLLRQSQRPRRPPCVRETLIYSVWRRCVTFFETVEDGRVHACLKKIAPCQGKQLRASKGSLRSVFLETFFTQGHALHSPNFRQQSDNIYKICDEEFMHDKKKIAIAILLSVIVFIIVLLGQMMLQQRDTKSPSATPPAQTEPAREPAPAGPVGSSDTAQPAAPAGPTARGRR